jgi:uncharacterized membrane protein
MKNHNSYLSVLITLASLLISSAQTPAQGLQGCTFTSIDYPGAMSTGARSSVWLRINAAGTIVGGYEDASGDGHGFLLSNENFLTVDGSGALSELNAINRDGEILADHVDANSNLISLLLSGGTVTHVSFPNGIETSVNSINGTGEIVGYHTDSDQRTHGYLLLRGLFESFDFPGANFTVASAINDAKQIVGIRSSALAKGPDFFAPGNTQGFLLNDGVFTSIDFPGSVFTTAIDINSEGTIVGRYNTADGTAHGYQRTRRGRFTTIDVPGAVQSLATGINSQGDIVGKYQTPDNKFHGFLLTCRANGRSEEP